MKQKFFSNIIFCFLLLYLITAFLKRTLNYYQLDNLGVDSITSILKFLLEVIIIGILFYNFDKKNRLFLFAGVLFFVFLVSEALRVNSVNYNFFVSLTVGNIFYFNKYIYPFLFLSVFLIIPNRNEVGIKYFEILEKVFMINILFVIVGFLFSINYFQSYPNSSRFGYSGLLDRVFFGYLSMILISRRVFSNKIDYKLLLLIAGLLLTGMKMVLLFSIILFLFYLYSIRKLILLGFTSTTLLICGIFFKPLILFFVKVFPFWKPILTEYGYVTLLFSKRDLLIINSWNYLSREATIWNFLVGGIDFTKYWIEMDFIDLFLFFGLIGSTIYVLLLSKIVKKGYHIIPLLATSLAGWFLVNPIIMCTYLLWLDESNKNE